MIQDRKAQVIQRGRYENTEVCCCACGQNLGFVPVRFGNDAGSLGLDPILVGRDGNFFEKRKRTSSAERGIPYSVRGMTIAHYDTDDDFHATSVPLDGRTIRVKCPRSECGVINEVVASR